MELLVTSVALITLPFAAYGAMWALGRLGQLVVDGGGGGTERSVPRNTPDGRVIPGNRREEAD